MVAVLVVVVCLLAGLAGAGYSSSPALCAAVYRPATTGYCIVAATTALPSPAAEAASRAAYSPASSLSFSQYNYHIITLQDWTVCLVKYRGASDVILIIVDCCVVVSWCGSLPA